MINFTIQYCLKHFCGFSFSCMNYVTTTILSILIPIHILAILTKVARHYIPQGYLFCAKFFKYSNYNIVHVVERLPRNSYQMKFFDFYLRYIYGGDF